MSQDFNFGNSRRNFDRRNNNNNRGNVNNFWTNAKILKEVEEFFTLSSSMENHRVRSLFIESKDDYISLQRIVENRRMNRECKFPQVFESIKESKILEIRVSQEPPKFFYDVSVKSKNPLSKEKLYECREADQYLFKMNRLMKKNFLQEVYKNKNPKKELILLYIDSLRKGIANNPVGNYFHQFLCGDYGRRINHFENCGKLHISKKRELCFCQKIDFEKAIRVPRGDKENGIALCENHKRHVETVGILKKYNQRVENYDRNNHELVQTDQIYIPRKNEYHIIKSSGLIPVYLEKNENKEKLFFLLGLEKKNKTYRFFGGKREVMVDENAFDTAIRECSEEIYGVFDSKNNSVKESIKVLHETYDPLFMDRKLDNFYSRESKFHNFVVYLEKKVSYEELREAKENYLGKNLREAQDLDLKMEKVDFLWVELGELLKGVEDGEKLVGGCFGMEGEMFGMDLGFLRLWKFLYGKVEEEKKEEKKEEVKKEEVKKEDEKKEEEKEEIEEDAKE